MTYRYSSTIISLASAVLLSACAYENRALQAEQSALKSTDGTIVIHSQGSQSTSSIQSTEILLTKSTIRTAIYAIRLSDAYKGLGDRAARNRDLSVTGLIAIAGAAALGNASSIGASELAAVIAVGAAVNEGVKYVNPGGAAEAFYSASESMACASTKIGKYYGSTPEEIDFHASSVALWYIRRIELLLRADLQREVPDFSSLLKRLGVGTRQEEVAALVEGARTPSKVEKMQAELDACIREAGGSNENPNTNSTPNNANQQGNVEDLPDVVVTDG